MVQKKGGKEQIYLNHNIAKKLISKLNDFLNGKICSKAYKFINKFLHRILDKKTCIIILITIIITRFSVTMG